MADGNSHGHIARSIVVSVIIPTYNRANLLNKGVESVLRQTFSDFEIIIVDDGSTDCTKEVVSRFQDDRIVYVCQANQGRSAARNRALDIARGKYIAFLDSDDEYLDTKLADQVAYMESHQQIGMVYTSAECIDEQDRLLRGRTYKANCAGKIYKQVAFFRPVTITLPTVMLRREVLDAVGRFDTQMERFEDTDLWRRIAKRFDVGAMQQITCRLRTHSDNVLTTQNVTQIVSSIEYYVAKILREDTDVDAAFLNRGAAGLYEYYGKAILTAPGWCAHGVYLMRRAIHFSPLRSPIIIFVGFKAMVGAYLRRLVF